MLIWFVNVQIAFFFGIWRRSISSAIAAPLIWWAVEFALFQIISAFTAAQPALPETGVRTLSNYLVWSNVYSLHDNLAYFVYGSAPGSVSNLHVLGILFVYVSLFIGLSC